MFRGATEVVPEEASLLGDLKSSPGGPGATATALPLPFPGDLQPAGDLEDSE